jgi:hypothetical protein
MIKAIIHLLIVCISYYLRLSISSMHSMLRNMTIVSCGPRIIGRPLFLYLIKFIFLSSGGPYRVNASVRALWCDSLSQRLLIIVEF